VAVLAANTLNNHWNIESKISSKIKIKEYSSFRYKKSMAFLEVKNKKILPGWAKQNSKIFVNGYSQAKEPNEDIVLRDSEAEKSFSFLKIDDDSININNFDKIIDGLLFEDYFEKKVSVFSKLPIPYYIIPFRHFIFRHLFYMRKKDSGFPNWPSDFSVELLRHLYVNAIKEKTGKKIPYVAFWPKLKEDTRHKASAKFAVSLTHDCDSPSSFKNIEKIREIEKENGFTSCWNVLSKRYKIPYDILKKLEKEGNEIGSHGYNHDGKIAFLPDADIKKRLSYSKSKLKNFNVRGFRSPQLKRNRRFLNLLADYFEYDSSVPNSEYKSSIALRTGSCTVFPFFIKNMVEVPLTMPQDFTLIHTMGYSNNKIINLWKEKIEAIRKINGLVSFNTHPDDYLIGNDKYLGIYEGILKYVSKQDDKWTALPHEVALWWKERSNSRIKNGKIYGSKRAKIAYI